MGSLGRVIRLLAQWLRDRWDWVLREERFRLSQPILTVPEIQRALARGENDQRFIAGLLLAAAPCVQARLAREYQELLEALERGSSDQLAS
jgi:hypothetical protein